MDRVIEMRNLQAVETCLGFFIKYSTKFNDIFFFKWYISYPTEFNFLRKIILALKKNPETQGRLSHLKGMQKNRKT